MCKLLAPDAAADDVGGIGVCGEPEETVPESFRDDGSRAGVVSIVAGVDVIEYAATLLRGDAAEEHS